MNSGQSQVDDVTSRSISVANPDRYRYMEERLRVLENNQQIILEELQSNRDRLNVSVLFPGASSGSGGVVNEVFENEESDQVQGKTQMYIL